MGYVLVFLGLVFMGAAIVGAGQRISTAMLSLVDLLRELAERKREDDITDESRRW